MKYIWVFIGLLSLVVTGCTAEWVIPEDYYVACESDADCPDTAQCREAEDGTSVCVTNGRAECGNGVLSKHMFQLNLVFSFLQLPRMVSFHDFSFRCLSASLNALSSLITGYLGIQVVRSTR